MLIAGACALVVTLADTLRLFVKLGDWSPVAVAAWAFWAVALFGPWAVALRVRRRASVPSDEAGWTYVLLGYGLAIFALRVIETCRGRG